ncbi:hypothetical protein AB3S75_031146 [Citrus x aurantiifolia]
MPNSRLHKRGCQSYYFPFHSALFIKSSSSLVIASPASLRSCSSSSSAVCPAMSRFLADVRPPSRITIAAVTLRSSSRKITEEEIVEYLVKESTKKGLVKAKVAKKLKAQKVSGYSNDSNPFGDSNLNEKFVWRKKIERDVSQGVPLEEFSVKAEKKRQRERMAEIGKVKRRRKERALEKAQHEEEMALLAREHALAEFQDWEKKEEEFHFDQRKLGSEIGLREGCVKPIDVLCKHLSGSDDLDIEINEPYMAFKGLTVKDMEELHDDIKMYLDLDRATPTHVEYWEALMVVCDWELAEARKKNALDRPQGGGTSC